MVFSSALIMALFVLVIVVDLFMGLFFLYFFFQVSKLFCFGFRVKVWGLGLGVSFRD